MPGRMRGGGGDVGRMWGGEGVREGDAGAMREHLDLDLDLGADLKAHRNPGGGGLAQGLGIWGLGGGGGARWRRLRLCRSAGREECGRNVGGAGGGMQEGGCEGMREGDAGRMGVGMQACGHTTHSTSLDPPAHTSVRHALNSLSPGARSLGGPLVM